MACKRACSAERTDLLDVRHDDHDTFIVEAWHASLVYPHRHYCTEFKDFRLKQRQKGLHVSSCSSRANRTP